MNVEPVPRVVAAGAMPAEHAAYALARYSRSPDSIEDSVAWVKNHDSGKFMEEFYFQYGHGSIADLGHVTLSLESISELAAVDVVDEPVWDGQQKSTRYQDFGRSGFVVPELPRPLEVLYRQMAEGLLRAYRTVQEETVVYLRGEHPRPAQLSAAAYERTIRARAFDVARYLLFLGIPTNVGQVTSIRVLERQIQRLGASERPELQRLAKAMAATCAERPQAEYFPINGLDQPVAPTLAKYMQPGKMRAFVKPIVERWMHTHLDVESPVPYDGAVVEISNATDPIYHMAAGLVYEYSHRRYNWIVAQFEQIAYSKLQGLLDEILGSPDLPRHEDLPRSFRHAPYVFDITMDIGGYRDIHRHRRQVQIRQEWTTRHGFSLPAIAGEIGGLETYMRFVVTSALNVFDELKPHSGAAYILPFATNCRSLHKMDFEQLRYVTALRSGVKGHDSYREVAWRMYQAFKRYHARLAEYLNVTPPEVQEPLIR